MQTVPKHHCQTLAPSGLAAIPRPHAIVLARPTGTRNRRGLKMKTLQQPAHFDPGGVAWSPATREAILELIGAHMAYLAVPDDSSQERRAKSQRAQALRQLDSEQLRVFEIFSSSLGLISKYRKGR